MAYHGAMSRTLALLLAPALGLGLLWPQPAAANHIQTFLGWSRDGTAYGYIDRNDGDESEDVLLCRTDPAVPSPSWPAGVAQGKSCTGLPCDDNGMCKGARQRKKLLATYLIKQPASRSGPQGQVLKLRKAAGKLYIEGAGRSFALDQDEHDLSEESELGSSFWRADGGAVGFVLRTPGYGELLFVRSLTGAPEPTPVSTARELAKAANTRGMRLHKAQDFPGAAAEFRTAIAADAGWVTPRYNLACALGRQGNAAGAAEQLQWLARSSEPDARRRLEKGRLDEDLAPVRGDARVRSLLGLGPATDAASTPAPVSGPGAGPKVGSARMRALGLALTAWTDQPLSTAEGENNDCLTYRSFKLAAGPLTVTGSYESGVALLDARGKQLATARGEACLLGLGLGQVAPDADPEIVVHRRVQVGRGGYEEQVVILKRAGDILVEVFAGVIPEEREAPQGGPPNLVFSPDGTIRYRDPYKKNAKEKLLRWSEQQHRFLP